ncbi:MAG: hypothetical protein ABIN58_10155 [candidate division WOR-3 bacterium]
MRRSIILTVLVVLALVFGTFGSTHAVTLVPDVWTDLPGVSGGAGPGTVVEDVIKNFSFGGVDGSAYTGTVQNRVLRHADNTLSFIWQVTNDSTSSGNIMGFRLGDFLSSTYDANWSTTSMGEVGVDAALLFSTPLGFVNFRFEGDGIAPGQSSRFFFLNTDATAYAETAIYDLTTNGPISSLYSTFAPSAVATPEPGIFLLLSSSLFGLAAIARSRRK